MSQKVSLPIRRVSRVSAPGSKSQYQVFEQEDDYSWSSASKAYDHSTSAFAALGRLMQKDVIAIIGEDTEL